MPKGLPTTVQLLNGEVSFFSIDTDLIQAAGYKFDAGELNQLPNQLPNAMKLKITEIVCEEIVSHRLESVTEAIQSFTSASKKLKHLANLPLEKIDDIFENIEAKATATLYFRKIVKDYAQRCRGDILNISGENLATTIFKLYFNNHPPFENRREKKSEFPDAASLFLLEQYATENETYGLIASGDGGWKSYAEESDNLFYVSSIDELAKLFIATNEHAEELKAKILTAVKEDQSGLRDQIEDELKTHLANSEWDVSEIESGAGRVDAEVYDSEIESFDINTDHTKIWQVEDEPSTWIVELDIRVQVNLAVNVDFYVWDSIDREEVNIGGQSEFIQTEINLDLFLTCSDVRLDSTPDEWEVEAETSNGKYKIDALEVEPDFSEWD